MGLAMDDLRNVQHYNCISAALKLSSQNGLVLNCLLVICALDNLTPGPEFSICTISNRLDTKYM